MINNLQTETISEAGDGNKDHTYPPPPNKNKIISTKCHKDKIEMISEAGVGNKDHTYPRHRIKTKLYLKSAIKMKQR